MDTVPTSTLSNNENSFTKLLPATIIHVYSDFNLYFPAKLPNTGAPGSVSTLFSSTSLFHALVWQLSDYYVSHTT